MTWHVYSDGSADPDQYGKAGWGCVIVSPTGERHEIHGPVPEPSASINRAELHAIRKGLKQVPAGATVTVFSDSQLSVNTLSGKWKARANKDLIGKVRDQERLRRTTYRWIKAHNGHPDNERADELANRGRDEARMAATVNPAWDDPDALERVIDRWRQEARDCVVSG